MFVRVVRDSFSSVAGWQPHVVVRTMGMEDYEQEKKIGQGAFGYVQACVRCVCGCDLYAEEKEDYKGKEGF